MVRSPPAGPGSPSHPVRTVSRASPTLRGGSTTGPEDQQGFSPTDGGAFMPTRRRRTAGSVRRLPSGRWQARIRDPRTNLLESLGSFDSKADADRAVAVAVTDGLRGQWASPALGKRRLADWVDEWWATTTDLAPTTRVRDEWLLRGHILPAFGSAALADIGQLDVRTWVAELTASGLAPNTVHKAYQVFSKAMAAAVDAGLLAITPCRNVPLPKVEHREMRFLSPAEI